jgi:hypothetical protein
VTWRLHEENRRSANGPRRARFSLWRRGPESNRAERICKPHQALSSTS